MEFTWRSDEVGGWGDLQACKVRLFDEEALYRRGRQSLHDRDASRAETQERRRTRRRRPIRARYPGPCSALGGFLRVDAAAGANDTRTSIAPALRTATLKCRAQIASPSQRSASTWPAGDGVAVVHPLLRAAGCREQTREIQETRRHAEAKRKYRSPRTLRSSDGHAVLIARASSSPLRSLPAAGRCRTVSHGGEKLSPRSAGRDGTFHPPGAVPPRRRREIALLGPHFVRDQQPLPSPPLPTVRSSMRVRLRRVQDAPARAATLVVLHTCSGRRGPHERPEPLPRFGPAVHVPPGDAAARHRKGRTRRGAVR